MDQKDLKTLYKLLRMFASLLRPNNLLGTEVVIMVSEWVGEHIE